MTRTSELILSLIVVLIVLVLGIAILGFGRDIGYILHGWLIAGCAGWAVMFLLNKLNEPDPDIPLEYSDDVIKWGVLACFAWGVFANLVFKAF